MVRNIRYKGLSQDLERMTKPSFNHSGVRQSVGLEDSIGEFFFLPISDLVPFHNQARKIFAENDINSLAESIKNYGIRQPLTVVKGELGKYEVVSGERRLRAASVAGLEKVPCIILQENMSADAVALIENIHRVELHPIELGLLYKKLLDSKIFETQSDLAEKISVSKSQVSEYLQYSTISENVQRIILENKIDSRAKLREILKTSNKGEIKNFSQLLINKKINNTKNIFTVLKISKKDSNIIVDESGIEKLSEDDKDQLKECIQSLLTKLSI